MAQAYSSTFLSLFTLLLLLVEATFAVRCWSTRQLGGKTAFSLTIV